MHKKKFAHNHDIFKRGPTARSPRHRALCGRRPAVLIGRVLLPELMEEVVLLVRKEETRFHLKGKTLNRTDCETERAVGVTFTVWMAPPPRCSRRISIAWFTVMQTERRSSRQAATVRQEKNRRAGGHVTHVTASPGKQAHQVKRMATERKGSHLSRIVRGLRSS